MRLFLEAKLIKHVAREVYEVLRQLFIMT